MSNDDTRGNESPERQDESQQRTPTYHSSLEAIDAHATDLLEAVTADETLQANGRRAAKRHCRELRAELDCLRRHLPVPDERYVQPSEEREGGVTTVSGPFEALREASRRRDDHEVDDQHEHEDTQTDETAGEIDD